MQQYGLIGRTLVHSFSRRYFTEKFQREGIDAKYDLFEIPTIADFPELIEKYSLQGLNVTIPYKEEILQYLDKVDPTAESIGAVNTIEFTSFNGKTTTIGYNTDCIGFKHSLIPLLNKSHTDALILGIGGAAKAVLHVLTSLGISPTFLSRKPLSSYLSVPVISYDSLTEERVRATPLIINTTPLGTFPEVNVLPNIPYKGITSNHVLYDLVYNPDETLFLKEGKIRGATIKNGLEMLELQAEAAWTIFSS